MLNKNPEKRNSLEEILVHDWVTNNGKTKVNIDMIEEFKDGKEGFGNIERLTKRVDLCKTIIWKDNKLEDDEDEDVVSEAESISHKSADSLRR